MLNKKIVAAAVAAAFTQSAVAVVDLDATASQKITYASELVTGTTGSLTVTNAANLLDVTTELGFTIGEGTSSFVRVNLTNATFGDPVAITVGTAATVDAALLANPSLGGQAGDDFVIFEISAVTGSVLSDDSVTFAAATYDVSDSMTSFVSYALYETSAGAFNQDPSVRLKTASVEFTELASASSNEFTIAIDNTATVDSGFTNFSSSSLGMTTATVGEIDTDLLVGVSVFTPAGVAVTDDDLLDVADGGDQAQTLSFDGDFSFGTWTLEQSSTCAAASPVALTIDPLTAASEATVPALPRATLISGDWYLCVEVDGTEVIPKGSYTATLLESALTDDLGEISYDTTSIEVPYITVLPDYNQRIYIINSGTQDAAYEFTFISEGVATATPGTAAVGVVPAGEMIALRSGDIVSVSGRDRTSAVIEVEGIDGDISAATQTVAPDGSTDTVILNANSIKSRLELDL